MQTGSGHRPSVPIQRRKIRGNMKRLIFAAGVVLAGCAQATQVPLQLVPDDANGAGAVPTATLTNPQGTSGLFTVTLANGDVLQGRFTAQPQAGPNMGVAGGYVDDQIQVQSEATVSMQASNAKESIECNGTRNISGLDVTCTLSDGSTYEGVQNYQDEDSGDDSQ